jgi:hypothetical protein
MKSIKVKDISKELAGTPEALDRLEAQERALELVASRRRPYVVPVGDKHHIVVGVMGDPHHGSLYHRQDAMQCYFDECDRRGVTDIVNAGDILAGHKVYKGQEFELLDHGFDKQIERFRKERPQTKAKIHFITGNHDGSFKNAAGASVGEAIMKACPNMSFVGEDMGTVVFTTKSGRKYSIMLMHPGGSGSSYAVSYKPQKLVESLSGGQKPNMLVIGHYHKAEMLPSYRNVCLVQPGTFESQTPFMKRGGLAAHVGGWIFEIGVGSRADLCHVISATFMPFYEEAE